MELRQRILNQNDCYKDGRPLKPRGVMVHSTGANNPWLNRYVAPDDGRLGKPSARHWNQSGVGACVHAFIGKAADGSVAVYQTLPWEMRGWHCARGPKGSGNDSHLSFEICEDDLADPVYFQAVYQKAVELTAHLCRQFGLDPQADGAVICHAEGYQRGIASNHGDVLHWFPRFGVTMDDFRADVAQTLAEEDETEAQRQFDAGMRNYLRRLAAKAPNAWSGEARAWAEAAGIIQGDPSGQMQYQKFCTREELIQILYALQKQ